MQLQDAAVTLFALAGAAVLVRRVAGAMRPSDKGAACPNCASGSAACAPKAAVSAPHAAAVDQPAAVPMKFIR